MALGNTIARAVLEIVTDTTQALQGMSSFSKDARKFGGDLGSIGTAALPITAALVGAGAAALTMSTNFNASMANVATLLPAGSSRVQEFKKDIREMAVETGKSTGDLAAGLYQVVSAFGDSADTTAILSINAKAAAAGLAETTDAINLTSAVTKGYGDVTASTVQHASDLAFQAVKLGQTTFPELAGAIGRVVPLSASLKVSQEELFGVMATFTGVTGTASEVSTQLRGVLQSLMVPTDAMSGLFEAVGVKSGEALVQQRGLQGTIELIVQSAQRAGVPLQKYIGSIEGQTLAISAAGGQAKTFTEKLEAMQHVVGETDAAFAKQTQGVNAAGFAWEQFKQRAVVRMQELGDVITPIVMRAATALDPLLNAIEHGIQWFSDLPAPIQTVGVVLAGLAAAAGPVLIVVGKLISTWGIVAGLFAEGSTLMTVLGGAMTILTGPIGLVVAAIGALAGISKAATGSWFGFLEPLQPIVDLIKAIASAVVSLVSTGLEVLWAIVKPLAVVIGEGLVLAFKGLLVVIETLLKPIGWLADGINWVADAARGMYGKVVDGSGPAVEAMQKHAVAAGQAAVVATTLAASVTTASAATTTHTEAVKAQLPVVSAVTDAQKAWNKSVRDAADAMLSRDLAGEIRKTAAAYALATKEGSLNEYQTQQLQKTLEGYLEKGGQLPPMLYNAWVAHHDFTIQIDTTNAALLKLLNTLPKVGAAYTNIIPPIKEVVSTDIMKLLDFAKVTPAQLHVSTPGEMFRMEFNRNIHEYMTVEFPKTIMSAITGGGSIFQSAGSSLAGFLVSDAGFGKKLAGGLTSIFGKGLGTAISSVLPGVASLVGPLIGKIANAFGSAGRDAVKDFAATFAGGFDGPGGLHEALNTLGAEGERLWIKLTQGVGKNNPQQARQVIEEITTALEAQKQKQKETAEAAAQAAAAQVEAVDAVQQRVLDQISELDKSRQSLMDSIANEAPEEVMGIVEAQTRAQIASIDAQKASLQDQIDNVASAGAEAVDAIGEVARTIYDDIKQIWSDPLTLRFNVEMPELPNFGMPAFAMAKGGFGRVEEPTLFIAGEAGGEDVAFSGGGRSFASVSDAVGGMDGGQLETISGQLAGIDRSLRTVIPALVQNAARFGAQTSGKRR